MSDLPPRRPDARRSRSAITDDVVMRFEHVYEVDPALMELTGAAARCRPGTRTASSTAALDHLDWMHDHFADEVLLAGEESETMPDEED